MISRGQFPHLIFAIFVFTQTERTNGLDSVRGVAGFVFMFLTDSLRRANGVLNYRLRDWIFE
jgi:hypothetical protein